MKRCFKIMIGGLAGLFAFSSCAGIPEGAVAVSPFDATRYLGKWYEIARMDFRFERGLNNTTANYSMNKDGSIHVVNRGYHAEKKKWKEAVGKAKFVGSPREARLKVSFFGPFYGSYNVIALDEQYQYALIAGKDLGYLWILSRQTTIPDNIRQAYLEQAKKLGYNTRALIWVKHDRQ